MLYNWVYDGCSRCPHGAAPLRCLEVGFAGMTHAVQKRIQTTFLKGTVMALFNKLPGYQRSPAGLERKVLRAIPSTLTLGLGALVLPSLLLRLTGRGSWDFDGFVSMVDIYAMGAVLFFVNLVVIVGTAAFIVMVMKGPAYVADAYDLDDAEAPRPLNADGTPKVDRHPKAGRPDS